MPLPNILSVVAENDRERDRSKRSLSSFFSCSLVPFAVLSKPLMDIKSADATELNAWSLETFFDRICGFVWAMIIVLTWTPWYLGFASLVRF